MSQKKLGAKSAPPPTESGRGRGEMNMREARRRWAAGQEEPSRLPPPPAGGEACEAKAPGNGETYGRGLGHDARRANR